MRLKSFGAHDHPLLAIASFIIHYHEWLASPPARQCPSETNLLRFLVWVSRDTSAIVAESENGLITSNGSGGYLPLVRRRVRVPVFSLIANTKVNIWSCESPSIVRHKRRVRFHRAPRQNGLG
jgi:hypothetical protein